jgi:hypothetical protein
MKNLWVLLFLLVPTLGFSQHEQITNEKNIYVNQRAQLFDQDLKKYGYGEPLKQSENKQPYIKRDPHLEGEQKNSHFEPEMIFAEPEYRTYTVYESRGKGHYQYTATECNKVCSGEKWTPEILKLFENYIHYLGLTDEEFKSRYVLQKFYNPQE